MLTCMPLAWGGSSPKRLHRPWQHLLLIPSPFVLTSPSDSGLCCALPAVLVFWMVLQPYPTPLESYEVCDSSLALSAFLKGIRLWDFYPVSPGQRVERSKWWCCAAVMGGGQRVSCEPLLLNDLASWHMTLHSLAMWTTLGPFPELSEFSTAFKVDTRFIFSGKHALAILCAIIPSSGNLSFAFLITHLLHVFNHASF